MSLSRLFGLLRGFVSVFGVNKVLNRLVARNGLGRDEEMKKLTGVKVTECSNTKSDEFHFSTNEKMAVKTGQLPNRGVKKIVQELVDHTYFIIENSDKNVVLPSDLEEQIRSKVEDQNAKGYKVQYFMKFGENIISTARMIELANPDYVYDPLWTPGTETESYTVKELNGSETDISVMGMFLNTEDTDYDPTLFLLDHPFDDKYPNGKISQVDAAKEFLAKSIDGLEIKQTDHRDVLSRYIMDKNNGLSPNDVILAQGWTRIPLGRRSVVGGSCVGCVNSGGGRRGLGGSVGRADDGVGVGFSAGLAD
ncbi:MAG: hypothetical protein LBK50_01670 [Candidatus Nomurabacteria bacterium]|jgi:hypothetical protein|nr:hypothetical protein [Candidatus Nomurabacteria bacterium]